MKKLFSLTSVVLALAAFIGCGRRDYPFFKPHHPALKKLSSGMELMALEDHEFPTAQLFFYIRGGSIYDPPGKEGLAALAMQALRLGGADGLTPDDIEKELEFDGTSLEMGAGSEFNSVALSGLTKDIDHGLEMLFDLLRKPKFDLARFETVKARAKDALLRDLEDPLRLSFREYPPLIYGEENPWGRRVTVQSLDSITRDDVLKFYDDFIHPDRILIAASGDFRVKELVKKIEALQKGWKPVGKDLLEIPPVKESYGRSVLMIPQKDITQSTVLVGHLGSKRSNPDKYALVVMNFILGGSGALTSRLGEEIRSSAGKAYSVWSDYGFGRDFGMFREVAQTALDNTEWVTRKLEEILKKMAEKPDFTEQEVTSAKKAILRALIFDFETRFAQVKEQARFHLWGYPDNYLESFQEGIAHVTKEDVERVAKKYLHPEGLKVLIVTNEKQVESYRNLLKDLTDSGSVDVRSMK